MSAFLTTILVITCIIVNIVIMLQPAKGNTTAFGGSSQSLFGSTGATSFLFKVTMWGAALIMAICLGLAVIQVRNNNRSVIDVSAPVATIPAMPPPVQAAPGIPTPVIPPANAPVAPSHAPTK